MLSCAGATLIVPDPATQDWIADNIDPSWLIEWTERDGPGHTLEGLPWRGQFPRAPIRVGTLTWPMGASRWAQGHFLADEEAVATIRQASTSTGWNSVELLMADGQRELRTQMYCLPPRPLARMNRTTAALWLITLVDERYLWWFRPAAITMTAGTTTWAELYTQIGTGLGITITAETIPEAYLVPSNLLDRSYRAAPVLLDAIAANVGQRIVRRLDGSVLAMGPFTSLYWMRTNLEREGSANTPPPSGRIAGHEFDIQVAPASGSNTGGDYGLTTGGILDFSHEDESGLIAVI